ncbi:MAG: hypothetical protein E7619_09535 [Ruminococcaceae bacterium]|nr:hypothetical protein [Oscillospiraceae bacterium]
MREGDRVLGIYDYGQFYRVGFFGHRYIDGYREVEARLEKLLREILRVKPFVECYVGRNGDFDQMVASTVRRVRREGFELQCALVLVLPYVTAEYKNNEESFKNYYDDVEICEAAEFSHPKAAFAVRNREIAERCDLIVCCVERESGGAFKAVEYAKSLGKTVINLSDGE